VLISSNHGNLTFLVPQQQIKSNTFLIAIIYSRFQDAIAQRSSLPILSISGTNMHQMRTDGKSIVQLEIARSGFSFDISSHPAKMGSIDKAKPSVRGGRKATGLLAERFHGAS
jgi:hypothetical protein